jgi:uncharacterized integral membrane protein (TIGR00697 family)
MDKERSFRNLDIFTTAFAIVLLLSNLVSMKLVNFLGMSPDAGLSLFPFSYILGDVLTEVYGLARARRAIWIGFGALLFSTAYLSAIAYTPPAPGWDGQESFVYIFGFLPRIIIASLVAFLVGERVNSWTLVKIKEITNGKHFWLRSIGSTITGEAVDTTLFLGIAFLGKWPWHLWIATWWVSYVIKVAIEIPVLPFTYRVVAWAQRQEKMA